MRTGIATVCLSGTLEDKLSAAARAGFDAVELFENDLIASPSSPEEVRERAATLGLEIALYQPFRDFENVGRVELAANLRRAEAKFELMNRLGAPMMLVCSNVATATVPGDDVAVSQLRQLAELAASHGVTLAYEALAWGRYVSTYDHAWRIVREADHPALGVCLDSFHICARDSDLAAIADIPADKLFFVQLADATRMRLDALSWSRHHRVFPGQGDFELPEFVRRLDQAGFRGCLSLEVFNDVFRQTDPYRTAVDARRSLLALRTPPSRPPDAFDFVEIRAQDSGRLDPLLRGLGFGYDGRHRTKDVHLWSQGRARIVVNHGDSRAATPTLAGLGFGVADPDAAATRAAGLLANALPRRRSAGEEQLRVFAAPDGTEVSFGTDTGDDPAWTGEFGGGRSTEPAGIVAIDHVSLVQPWQHFDEAVLFYRSILSLTPTSSTQVADPGGLVRSQVMGGADAPVRLTLNVLPNALAEALPAAPEHIALLSEDAVATASLLRSRGVRLLDVPVNYYEDLSARFDLSPEFVGVLAENRLLYDRDGDGEYLQLYTETVGNVFFEVVQRIGGYDGYGAANSQVRRTVQAS